MAKKNTPANYKVEIIETSKELTPKERIAFKDTGDAVKLEHVADEPLTIKVVDYAKLSVHNEASENVDYEVFILVDADGTKYVTGSSTFFDSFINIYNEMKDSNEEWAIKVYKVPSKNYAGKSFLTCSII